MNEKQLNEILEISSQLEKDYDFNDYIENYIDEDEFLELENGDEVVEYIRELNEDFEITDTEITYYASAIEYLKENDPSLQESLELASDMGFEVKDLDSEKLASLLASENNRDDFEDYLDELLGMINKSKIFE